MPPGRSEKCYEITWLIRRLYRAMGSYADQYLADSGLSAADRAVMEFLYPAQKLSVPQIARRYDVSRQHVQVTVNALVNRGLLRSGANPEHKRSPLVRLSSLGRDCFEEIRRNESALIDDLFRAISEGDLDVTRSTLNSMYEKLK